MPSLRVYDTKGNEHSPTGGGGRSNERVKDLFYDGVRLTIESGRERKFTMFFRARETRNARTEQFYAVYTTRDGAMREFIDALRDRIETEWGYTIDDSADDMSVFRAIDAGNTSMPGSDQDRAILEELIGSRQGGTVSVRDAESALGLVNEFMGTYNRAAVADSPESNALSDFDLVVAPNGSSGVVPIGDTESRWESTKESMRSRLIDEEIASINESVQTLSREHGLSSSEIRRRVSQRVPALSAPSSGGSTADRLSSSGSSRDLDMAEIGKYVAIGAIVLIVLIGGFFGATYFGLIGGGGGDAGPANGTDAALASINGTVVDASGEPIGSSVEVTAERIADAEGNETDGPTNTTTAEGGTFTLENVSTGTYEITAGSTDVFEYGSEEVEVTENGTDEVELAPTSATVSGTVVDANGEELDATVELLDGNNETVNSATGGSYEFSVAEPSGSYSLTAEADGHESVSRPVESFGDQGSITLEESTFTLSGTVTDSNDNELDAASVTVTTADGFSDTTPAGGAYEIEGIPAGEHQIEVTRDGYTTVTETVTGDDDVTRDFDLEENGAIDGTTNASGSPARYELELLQDGETLRETSSDQDTGEYLIEGLDPGEYTLIATRSGESREVTVQVNSGETTTQDINIDF
ncbi:carboxypeptidase-like regulatory domain-containing protein [Halorubrum cibi]|uniref:Carboxypeptidase regulatory-like domain-containing protein n=1 Tax=Halorubrum cibi TaxID=413815 RepID=A0A521DJK6_9EURY|nr:carboxypeptidase-like regulatory domain-containing protein [Halorubrum cibi]SMO71909.1 Carboxypeptidase regulatory-like domain-containing protein [Halorubrum cibi]